MQNSGSVKDELNLEHKVDTSMENQANSGSSGNDGYDQYGGGNDSEDTNDEEEEEEEEEEEPPGDSEAVLEAKKTYLTDDELEFFQKFTSISRSALVRVNDARLAMPPTNFKFKNLDQVPEEMTLSLFYSKIFDIFIRMMIGLAEGPLETTKFMMRLGHAGFRENAGFFLPGHTYMTMDGGVLANEIARMCQSNTKLFIDDTFVVEMQIFKHSNNLGGGCGDGSKKFDLKIKSQVQGSGMCLPKAFAIGLLDAELRNTEDQDENKKKLANKKARLIRKGKTGCALQEKAGMEVMLKAGIDTKKTLYDRSDLLKLAEAYDDHQIVVWTKQPSHYNYFIDFHENRNSKKLISLVLHNCHYDFCIPTRETLNAIYCKACNIITNNKNHYKSCDGNCQKCGNRECEEAVQTYIKCQKCGVGFTSQKCFDHHKKIWGRMLKPRCETKSCCPDCFKTYFNSSYGEGEKHVCGDNSYCRTCRRHQNPNEEHNCCHNPPNAKEAERAKKKQEEFVVICYDFESVVVDNLRPIDPSKSGPPHVPNVVCYRMFCNMCFSGDCESCTKGTIKYNSDNTKDVLEAFTEFLMKDKRLNGAHVIAHNGGRYDHNFVLACIMKKFKITPKCIIAGNTIVSADVVAGKESKLNSLYFRDSVQYLPMRLAAMPKAFGLQELKKGFFPYLFNHSENFGKTFDEHPARRFFDVKFMNVKDRAEFETWYRANKHKKYDFDNEIVSYCVSDVEILTKALMKYITICKDALNGWNPILSAVTLAGFVLHLFKYEHIKKGDIGFIPENGFPGRNNSIIALKFIMWLNKSTPGMNLRHKLNGGEYEVKRQNGLKFFVDAIDLTTKTIYEVYGCVHHGCPTCVNPNDISTHHIDKTYQSLYDETMARQAEIEALGYKVEAVWEHDIHKMLKSDKVMRKFFDNCRHTHHLRPRESMYGGRVQPFRCLVKPGYDELIQYLDFCSLYPWVNMIGAAYPRGQPSILRNDFKPIQPGKSIPYRGMVFCDVLPPTSLDLPVLPYRSGGKLLFPLCRMCTETLDNTKCTHKTVTERYLTGVWYSEELNEAISHGYQILKYHEVWHWDDWHTGGFFASYLKPLLKMKHEASGWPEDNMSDDAKKEYLDEIFKKDGIHLDQSKIFKNPAMRSLAKLFLNSAWGKFAENPMKVECKIFEIKDHTSQGQFMNESGYEVTNLTDWRIYGFTIISRKCLKDVVRTRPYANVVIGSITTSVARLRLYKAMEKVGKNLAYVDTDSLIFTEKKGQDLLGSLIGSGLGYLESEIATGDVITRLVAVAPKAYGYDVVHKDQTTTTTIKAKGITLDSTSVKSVTLDNLERMMLEHLNGQNVQPISTERMLMSRKRLAAPHTVHMIKKLKPCMDKLIFNPDGTTQALGWNLGVVLDQDYPF